MHECAKIAPYHLQSEYNEYSCPIRCSEDYYPLCAVNGVGDTKVFVNDCYMAMENCKRPKSKSKSRNCIEK